MTFVLARTLSPGLIPRRGRCGRWIDTASVCLPVPAGHNYADTTSNTLGKASTRFAIAETKLTLGKWQRVDASQSFFDRRSFKAKTDGFVFCSVEARDAARGYVTCAVDNTIIAAASVHNYHPTDNWLQYASF